MCFHFIFKAPPSRETGAVPRQQSTAPGRAPLAEPEEDLPLPRRRQWGLSKFTVNRYKDRMLKKVLALMRLTVCIVDRVSSFMYVRAYEYVYVCVSAISTAFVIFTGWFGEVECAH